MIRYLSFHETKLSLPSSSRPQLQFIAPCSSLTFKRRRRIITSCPLISGSKYKFELGPSPLLHPTPTSSPYRSVSYHAAAWLLSWGGEGIASKWSNVSSPACISPTPMSIAYGDAGVPADCIPLIPPPPISSPCIESNGNVSYPVWSAG